MKSLLSDCEPVSGLDQRRQMKSTYVLMHVMDKEKKNVVYDEIQEVFLDVLKSILDCG